MDFANSARGVCLYTRKNFQCRALCQEAIPDRTLPRRYLALSIAAALLAPVLSSGFAAPAMAQGAPAATQPILKLGDAAVTGFSGVVAKRPPAGGKPEDYFFIDRDGNSLIVFDLQNMKGPEDARLVDAPRKFAVQAKQIGQVFGVALDDRTPAPNIYVTATTLYGYNIVDAKGRRVKNGGPGVQWMPGQFGPGGGPGSIWKIEGTTGKVSLFANVTYQNRPNSAPGLGNIAFDPVSKHLFISDLETGMVHRFDLNGQQIGIYDHGVSHGMPYDPSQRMPITNTEFSADGYYATGGKRQVFGLAVYGGRLFYAIEENAQIWSVAINANGTFGRDARVEVTLKDRVPIVSLITDITFGRDGTMYTAQRGPAQSAYDFGVMAEPQISPVLAFRKKRRRSLAACRGIPDRLSARRAQHQRRRRARLRLRPARPHPS
jgi:hypothetical protein